MPVLLSGEVAKPWPDNPFRSPDGTEAASLRPPPYQPADRSDGWGEAAASARIACEGLRLIEGDLHRAVPEPFALLGLAPAGRRNRLSVSFGPWTRPTSRTMPFPLDRFDALLAAVIGIHGKEDDVVRGLSPFWPSLPVRGIYGPCPVVVPILATPPNLDSLPTPIRDLYRRAQALEPGRMTEWREIAGEIGLELALVDEADPEVAHGVYWLRTEMSLPLLALGEGFPER